MLGEGIYACHTLDFCNIIATYERGRIENFVIERRNW